MPHSFGQVVLLSEDPDLNIDEYEEMGNCVKLHCLCMSNNVSKEENYYKPWANEEFTVLTESEYQHLVRFHDETCSIALNAETDRILKQWENFVDRTDNLSRSVFIDM